MADMVYGGDGLAPCFFVSNTKRCTHYSILLSDNIASYTDIGHTTPILLNRMHIPLSPGSEYIWDERVDNLPRYVFHDAPWHLVIKNKNINRVIYPRTRLPVIGTLQYNQGG